MRRGLGWQTPQPASGSPCLMQAEDRARACCRMPACVTHALGPRWGLRSARAGQGRWVAHLPGSMPCLPRAPTVSCGHGGRMLHAAAAKCRLQGPGRVLHGEADHMQTSVSGLASRASTSAGDAHSHGCMRRRRGTACAKSKRRKRSRPDSAQRMWQRRRGHRLAAATRTACPCRSPPPALSLGQRAASPL